MNKCCGTCAFWVRNGNEERGDCFIVQDVPSSSGSVTTLQHNGKNCPLYEAKDGEKE